MSVFDYYVGVGPVVLHDHVSPVTDVSALRALRIRTPRLELRLGYREVRTHVLRPRGEPVVHLDLLLEAADWRSPVEVELDGVQPCLSLFGAPAA
jgi:hypothetical protein